MTEGTITTLRLEQILTRERLLIMEHERVQTEVGRYHRNNRIMFPSKGDHPTKILGMTSDGWVVYLGMDDTPWAYVRPQDEAKKKFTNTDTPGELREELKRLINQYLTLESSPIARESASEMSAHQSC